MAISGFNWFYSSSSVYIKLNVMVKFNLNIDFCFRS